MKTEEKSSNTVHENSGSPFQISVIVPVHIRLQEHSGFCYIAGPITSLSVIFYLWSDLAEMAKHFLTPVNEGASVLNEHY